MSNELGAEECANCGRRGDWYRFEYGSARMCQPECLSEYVAELVEREYERLRDDEMERGE